MDTDHAILELVREVGGLSESVKDLKEDFGKHCSKINGTLTLIQNGEMSLCKERGARLDRFQGQITALRNGKAESDNGGSKNYLEITKKSVRAAGWPVLIIGLMAWMYFQQHNNAAPVANQREMIRMTAHEVVKLMEEKEKKQP